LASIGAVQNKGPKLWQKAIARGVDERFVCSRSGFPYGFECSIFGFEEWKRHRLCQRNPGWKNTSSYLDLEREAVLRDMLKVKDTLRATVNLTFDGRAIKAYHGPDAEKRFTNEVRILRYLEARGCGFVPRLIEADSAQLRIVTTSCGTRVEHLDAERARELFVELETFGVRHEDPDVRNVTYRQSDGRFCLVDFEFATILPGFGPIPPP
jgi:hypothetical protein